MNMHIEAVVASPLDRLEVKGRRFVVRRARRAAIRTAARWAAGAAVLASELLLIGALFGYRATAWSVAAVPAFAIVVGAIVVAVLQQRVRVARADALATLDRRLATNDRISTVDEFVGLPNRDGYRQAAIEEAVPWLHDALAARVEAPATGRVSIRRDATVMVGAAAVLTLAALMIHGAQDADGVRVREGDGRSADAIDAPTTPVAAAVERVRDVVAQAVAAAAGTAATSGARSADSAPAAGSPGGKAGAGAGAAGKESGASPKRESASASDAAARAGDRPGSPGGRNTPKGSAGSAQTGDPGGMTDQKMADDRTGEDSRPAADPAGRAPPPPPQAPPRLAGSLQPPASSSQTPARGSQQVSASNSRAPASEGNQAKRGQGSRPGQSRNGAKGQPSSGNGGTTGADALKRSRGAAALMLAVPMDDRVAGSMNPGRSTSIVRPSRPRGSPAPVVAAGDRGTQNGTAGDVTHRATSVHDDALVRDYFLRRNGQAR